MNIHHPHCKRFSFTCCSARSICTLFTLQASLLDFSGNTFKKSELCLKEGSTHPWTTREMSKFVRKDKHVNEGREMARRVSSKAAPVQSPHSLDLLPYCRAPRGVMCIPIYKRMAVLFHLSREIRPPFPASLCNTSADY